MISCLQISTTGKLIAGFITYITYDDFHFIYSSVTDFIGEPFYNYSKHLMPCLLKWNHISAYFYIKHQEI